MSSSGTSSRADAAIERLPHELLLQIFGEVRLDCQAAPDYLRVKPFHRMCEAQRNKDRKSQSDAWLWEGYIEISRKLQPAVIETLYRTMSLKLWSLKRLADTHRTSPLQSRLHHVRDLTVDTKIESPAGQFVHWRADLAWLLEHVQPCRLELAISAYRDIQYSPRLIQAVRDHPLVDLRLIGRPPFTFNDALEFVEASHGRMQSLDIDYDVDPEDTLPLPPLGQEHPYGQLSWFCNFPDLRRLSIAAEGLHCLSSPSQDSYFIFLENAFPCLTSLAVEVSIDSPRYREEEQRAGLQYLLEQHGRKLRSLAISAKTWFYSRHIPPHTLPLLCPDLERLEIPFWTAIDFSSVPDSLQHLVVQSCRSPHTGGLVSLLRTDKAGTYLSGLRNFTVQTYITVIDPDTEQIIDHEDPRDIADMWSSESVWPGLLTMEIQRRGVEMRIEHFEDEVDHFDDEFDDD